VPRVFTLSAFFFLLIFHTGNCPLWDSHLNSSQQQEVQTTCTALKNAPRTACKPIRHHRPKGRGATRYNPQCTHAAPHDQECVQDFPALSLLLLHQLCVVRFGMTAQCLRSLMALHLPLPEETVRLARLLCASLPQPTLQLFQSLVKKREKREGETTKLRSASRFFIF